MKEEILNLIEQYDSIIIARHKKPDLDAYGSQFGLYYALREKYPKKKIYKVGDTNPQNYFEALDEIGEDIYKESLVFILDTVAKQMLEESVYQNYDKLILIDHHKNDPDIAYDIAYQIKDASSCSEIIADLLLEWDISINEASARALYMGIIADTGRFRYSSTSAKTLKIASILLEKGVEISKIHNLLYTETKETKQLKNVFFNLVEYTSKNIAYRKNDLAFLDKYNLTTNYCSRGLINQMAGMDEVKIWVNFTTDRKTDTVICEIRSRAIPVIDVAKKYGGGGHASACGCTLSTWEETDKILEDLEKLLEDNNG